MEKATNYAQLASSRIRAAVMNVRDYDPASLWNTPGTPPNFGQMPVPHIFTMAGRFSLVSKAYLNADEALLHDSQNAERMRVDCGIMESLEARQRAVALLNWQIEPEDSKSFQQKELAEQLTAILQRTPRFLEMRRNLLEATWYGRYGIALQYSSQIIGGHPVVLFEAGYRLAAAHPDDEPFEIPAQGLGLFTCRREAWLGFNPHFRAFGGEEGYIHEKYRQHGRKSLCLPFLRWLHRFARPNGVKYTLTQEDKIRNYVLGFEELGLDVRPIHEHFASEGMRDETWAAILADSIGFRVDTSKPLRSSSGRPVLQPQPAHTYDLDSTFDWLAHQPRDLNEHMALLKLLSSRCQRVAEMTKRRESSIALLAGKPKYLLSYQEENDAILELGQRYKASETTWDLKIQSLDSMPMPRDEIDMLFIDTRHNAARARQELAAWAPHVSRYIVFHDTEANGIHGDNGCEGLIVAIRELVAQGEWFVAGHYPNQYGLTVLSRDPADKPPRKIWLWPPGFGPGTEMFEMLKEIGVTERPNCSCKSTALQMDRWGVAGCREEPNFQWILDQVNHNAANWSWGEKLQIAATTALDSKNWKLAWRLNPLDLNRSLIEEAIRRAEMKGYE